MAMTGHPLARGMLACCGAAAVLLALGAAPLYEGPAPLVIGVVLPESDAALQGVQLGAAEAEHTAALLRESFAVHVQSAGQAGDAAAARRLVAAFGVHVIIGGGDGPAASALMSVADSTGVLFINVGAADDSLRARCSARTLHVLPSHAMRRRALELVNEGDSAAAWHDSLERYGAGQVNDRFRARFAGSVNERAWAGWVAAKVAWEIAQRAQRTTGAELAAFATSADASFDGHKGLPLSFHPRTHQLRQPLYVLAGDSVIAEVPTPRDEPDMDPAALLDRLAAPDGKVTCGPR
jgi:ABC-type branched-subunit amino acid transport system substrate-binding protein